MGQKWIILFLLLFIALPSSAQSGNALSFTIKGQVVDSLHNAGVPYATLQIVLADNPRQTVKMLACGSDGMFETTLTAPGAYLVFIQSLGKTTVQKEFTMEEGTKTVDLGILYMTDDVQILGEVTVTAQRPLVRVDIDKIAYSLEADPEAKVNNLLEMLRKVPLITVDGEGKIQLKGSTNFKIYMNGKPSNLLANNPSEVLRGMPASSAKDVEVITDPGAKYDAEGIGGIINIITHKNSSLEGIIGAVRANATTVGHYGGGAYLSAKVGKLGITTHYNYQQMNAPWNNSSMERENLINDQEYRLVQNGRYKPKGPFQYGYLEATYEIDTLNLLSVGVNISQGKRTLYNELGIEMFDRAGNSVHSYDRNSTKRVKNGSRDINVDYQRSTRRKDEFLTLSYRFSDSPNDNEDYTDIFNIVNYHSAEPFPQQIINDASTREHTGQVDYTTPIGKLHTVETGLKYINRHSRSKTQREVLVNNDWQDIFRSNDDFRYMQHIYAGYLGYALRVNKFGLKTGIRAEGTALDVKFDNAPEQNFKTDYFDVVPNITLSYQPGDARQLRLGYNMRISRPGISHLNPYVNDTDPQNISYGNPRLDSEQSNNVSMNYSSFTPKLNMNIGLNYNFVNNAIERYTFIDPDNPTIAQTTFGNIGKRQHMGGFLYLSWSPTLKFRITLNGGINYADLKSKRNDMGNNGWYGNVFVSGQYTFPEDIRFNVSTGYYSPQILLQGEGSSFYFVGLSLAKDFFAKKLTVSLSTQNPFFWKYIKMTTISRDDTFSIKNINHSKTQMFGINVSYRFGSLKQPIKKVKRGIKNDDIKSGGNSEQQEGGQQ